MRRSVVFGAIAVVAVAAVGGWYFLGRGGAGGGATRAGVGAYEAAMSECQDQVFADAMEDPNLKFVAGTTWHEVRADQSVLVGGKMSKLNEVGQPRTYNYQCIARGNRVIAVDVR
jgi:hypothetical protein